MEDIEAGMLFTAALTAPGMKMLSAYHKSVIFPPEMISADASLYPLSSVAGIAEGKVQFSGIKEREISKILFKIGGVGLYSI